MDFVDKHLSHEDGSFLSAIDADSEGEEGKSYVWTEKEFEDILGEDSQLARELFGTTPEGNFLDERSRERAGANVLTLSFRPERSEVEKSIRARLLEAREKRIQPIIDDKVLTDWNGMMIAAMARGGVALAEQRFIHRASMAADALIERFSDNGLTHSEKQNVAFLDDYAFFILALVELHQADFNTSRLRAADRFAAEMLRSFEDKGNGGYFMTRDVLPGTGARPKAAMDSAYRSGYATATLALVKLGRILQKPDYLGSARRAIDSASGDIESMPTGHTGLLLAHHELTSGVEVVVSTESKEAAVEAIAQLLKAYSPSAIFFPVYPNCDAPEFAKSLEMVDGKTTYYVCRNFACELPTTDRNVALQAITNAR
jgi:uncharacterized protein YyaL (SSP411 family)